MKKTWPATVSGSVPERYVGKLVKARAHARQVARVLRGHQFRWRQGRAPRPLLWIHYKHRVAYPEVICVHRHGRHPGH